MENKKLAAKQIGRNIVMVIEGTKYSKKTEDNTEVKSIQTKIELYNKRPSKTKLDEIINIMSPKKKEKEDKGVKIKGVKALVKKEKKATKKTSSKVEEITDRDLISEIREAHAGGKVTDDQIKSLQDLLAKVEAERKESLPKEQAKQEVQKQSPTYGRRGEY